METQQARKDARITGRREGRGADKLPVPRSSSPVSVYIDFPCIIDQAFSTIAWDDLEVSHARDSLCSQIIVRAQGDDTVSEMTTKICAGSKPLCWWGFQVNESDPGEQYFGDYALDFIADSTSTRESSLSPAELLSFQGCVIPPLTPQRVFSPEENMVHSSTETVSFHVHDEASWRGMAECHERALGQTVAINKQLHETLQRRQQELDSLEERNRHLRQLASRAKQLASVLEKLMTVRDVEPAVPPAEHASVSSCKRQRLDEGYETEPSDSVEDMLRDISSRCNAVLLSSTAGEVQQQEPEKVHMYGAFSGLQTSTPNSSTWTGDGAETSFRTSVREHGTMRTQVFPHGHVFTAQSQQGGYRFRWVPNHS